MLLSLWCVIAVVVLLGEGLEGRYDPQSVSRHHRHRHYQTRERGPVARGGSRRYDDEDDDDDWDGTKNNDFYERAPTQHRPAAFERVFRDRHRRRGATSSGWYGRRQVGRGRERQQQGRLRPDYYGSTSSKWRIDGARHVSLGGRGNRGGWSRHDLGIYSRRWPRIGYPRSYEDTEEYEDEYDRAYDDEWYYDDEDAEDSSEYRRGSRRKRPGSRRKGHGDWRRERRPPASAKDEEVDESYDDYYDYEDAEPLGKRKTARDRTTEHGRRDAGVGEKKDEASGRRGDQRKKKKRWYEDDEEEEGEEEEEEEEEGGSEDVNEVDVGKSGREDEEDEDDEEENGDGDEYPWNIDDNDILDESEEPSRGVKKLPLTLNEIIQKLTSDLGPTTSEEWWRRNHGSAGTEKRQGVGKMSDGRNSSGNNQRGSRVERKKNATEETSWTSAGNAGSKFTVELDHVTEAISSTTRSAVTSVTDATTTPSSVISVVRENEEPGRKKGAGDLEIHRKSLDEEDFDAYENDDGEGEEEDEEDEDEDAEEEAEKRDYSESDDPRRDKAPSADREPDYAEDEVDGGDDEEDSDDSQVAATTPATLPWFELPQFSDRTSKMIHKGRIHARHERLLSTRSAMTATTEYPRGTDLSRQKWEKLGDPARIEMERRSMTQINTDVSKALNHFQTVSREGSCRWPGKRVIPVKDVYPSPAKTYFPHCVILHRCTDDTGCCRVDSMTCVPKHEETVELYFYSKIVLGNTIVEKLKFSNHTECQCIKIRKSTPPPQNITQGQKRCTCPSSFVARTKKDQCECHCPENSQPCTRLRRGKDTFSVSDNVCIASGMCTSPTCEFGEYMSEKKRCPNRAEGMEILTKHFETRNHLRSRK